MEDDVDVFDHALAPGCRLRFVTFNIRHAEAGIERVIETLRSLSPDVVFLQEVDCRCRRSGDVDQAAMIAQALRFTSVFGAAFPFDGGEYGLALLARGRLDLERVLRLPHPTQRRGDGFGEPRLVLVARHGDWTLACTHLGLDPQERMQQARAVQRELRGYKRLVLAGDLNEPPGDPVSHLWRGWLTDAFQEAGGEEKLTAPPDRPQHRIDFIFRSVDVPPATGAFVGPAGASDHRPVIVDFADRRS